MSVGSRCFIKEIFFRGWIVDDMRVHTFLRI